MESWPDNQAELSHGRSVSHQLSPLSEFEIAELESLLEASTVGPLVPDEQTDGSQGTIVASFPNGSHVVDVGMPFASGLDDAALHAHLQLFCRSRGYLTRLLSERSQLLDQVERLQLQLDSQISAQDPLSTPHLPR